MHETDDSWKVLLNDSHHNFFSWRGNILNFEQSLPYYYTFVALLFVAVIMIWIYKKPFNISYNNFIQRAFKSERNFYLIIGIIGLLFTILRIIILFGDGYPSKFEIVPLHLCRLILTLTFIFFVFNKPDWVANLSFIAFGSAIAGILGADLYKAPIEASIEQMKAANLYYPYNIGIDSFVFNDYLATHFSALLIPFITIISRKTKITWIKFVITNYILILLTFAVFFANYALGKYASASSGWKANWFYLATPKYNPLMRNATGLFSWPWMVYTYISLGLLYMFVALGIYLLQDKFSLELEGKKHIFKIMKSSTLVNFLNRG